MLTINYIRPYFFGGGNLYLSATGAYAVDFQKIESQKVTCIMKLMINIK